MDGLPTHRLRAFSSPVIKGCSTAGSRISCSMKCYKLSELTHAKVNSLTARPRIEFSKIFSVVNPIVNDIHSRGGSSEMTSPLLSK